MQDRSARIRYQDIATNSSPLQCGLPQGSPVSPILFLLYTEPIYRLGSSKGRFGYADDTAILCVGDSLDETSAEASHHTEVMHFSRTTPKTAPPVLHGEFEKRPGRAMRWLGVWLDSTLSFKTHVEKWTASASSRLPSQETDKHQAWSSTERCATSGLRLRHSSAALRGGGLVSWFYAPALDQAGQGRTVQDRTPQCIENETAKKFRDWLQALSPRTLVVYSDGSRSTEGHAGYGYVVHRDGSTVLRDKGRLGPAEIFDAEAKGNEEADALAKAGASLPEPADNVPTLAHLRKIARQQPEEAFKAWWEASAPERYRDLRLKATTSCLVTTMRD
ncbi:reverse transcriptase (RNA-dependent DNA polymerase) [Hirsutella rhossiliensis]